MMVRAILAACVMFIGFTQVEWLGAEDIARLQAGVVKITAKPPEGTANVGTGFIVRVEREAVYIVTAAHVVVGDQQPRVEFFTKRNLPIPAEVLGLEGGDEVRGLALLVVRGAQNFPTGLTALSLAGTARLTGGEDIMVIGFPRNAGPWAIVKGNISSRQGRDLFFSPSVESGHSGGPIFQGGKVVGVVGAGSLSVGRGVTVGSVEDYLDGFGVTPPPAPPTVPAKSESHPPTNELEITGKDGAPMVHIPAGEFQKGGGVKSDDREGPMRHVVLDAFYMDKYEVTVALYAKFLRDTGRSKPQLWDHADIKEHQDRPVVNLNWYDAKSYCEWASKRLPTAAESEYASRGNDGRLYPWGNEDPLKGRFTADRLTNFGRGYDGPEDSKITENEIYSHGVAPVGSHKRDKSPFDIYDMAGNAAEWVADWCCEKGQDDQQGVQQNPKGPSSGKTKLIRLGNWETSNNPLSTFFGSRVPDRIFFGVSGVRCVQDIKK